MCRVSFGFVGLIVMITTRPAWLRLDGGSTVIGVGGVSIACLSNPQLFSMNSQKTIRRELL